MQRKERFHKAISYLKGKQIISTNQDVVDRMNVNKSSFSLAFNGNEKYLTDNFLKRFNVAFDEIFDIDWLLTGEGEMIKQNETSSINSSTEKMIPFYDVEAAAGVSYGMDISAVNRPSKMIRMGDFLSDSEAAIQVFGNSMTPNYPAGCIVGTKLHTDSFIEPGAVYVIETRDNRYIKRLYYSDDGECFECESDNHMLFEEGSRKGKPCYPMFRVPFDEVIRLHRVTGVIKRNIL